MPSTTMSSRIGSHAVHSNALTSWMCASANSGLGVAERDLLEHPEQVAGREHGADRGDDHVRRGTAPPRGPCPGSNAERIAGNSPQNPARPGSPRLAITQNPRIQPIFGACTQQAAEARQLAGVEVVLHRTGDEEQHAGDQAVRDHAEDRGVDAERR